MKWLESKFNASTLAPADFVISRHVEVLRSYAALTAIFPANKISLCPLGRFLETGNLPCLFVTMPSFNRQPGPGIFNETVRISDIVRFMPEPVTSDEGERGLYKPSVASLASLIIKAVESNSQLTYDTGTEVIPLVSRVDLSEFAVERIKSENGAMSETLDMRLDFTYTGLVAKSVHRLWSLVTAGA